MKDSFTKQKTDEQQVYKFIEKDTYEIKSYFGIPSSITLMQIETSGVEDTRVVKHKKL